MDGSVAYRCDLLKVKTSDERKGHALEGIVWWSLRKFEGARFVPQQHPNNEGMHPYRRTVYLTKPVGRRKRCAEIDGVWESTESALLHKDRNITNLLEVKYTLIRKDDVKDFVDIARFSKEYGASDRETRVVKNGVIVWMAGEAMDNNASILIGSEYLTVASYVRRLGIKFVPMSTLNCRFSERGWEVK